MGGLLIDGKNAYFFPAGFVLAGFGWAGLLGLCAGLLPFIGIVLGPWL